MTTPAEKILTLFHRRAGEFKRYARCTMSTGSQHGVPVMRSYARVIAAYHTKENGEPLLLLSSQPSSQTTGRHIQSVRDTSRVYSHAIWYVWDPEQGNSEGNVRALLARVWVSLDKVVKARTPVTMAQYMHGARMAMHTIDALAELVPPVLRDWLLPNDGQRERYEVFARLVAGTATPEDAAAHSIDYKRLMRAHGVIALHHDTALSIYM